MANPKCWHYSEKDPEANATCLNCHHWGWTRCKDEALLTQPVEYNREIESLMRHDGYSRGRGGIRQTRR